LGFFNDQRVELIEGEISVMPRMVNPHAVAIGLAQEVLRSAFGAGYWIRNQLPLDLGPRSEPQSDFAVVPGEPRDYRHHPRTALLVVEISDTSLSYDRVRKSELYARAVLADYWIVNLVDMQLEVFREPHQVARWPRRSAYETITILKGSETVTPLAAANARIKVRDLLP
jgi:Uma2 family endonuclease